MTTRQSLLIPLALSLACLTGCSSAPPVGAGESDLTGEHFPATHCEVFFDRAAPSFSSHGSSQLTLYVKTPLDKVAGHGGVRSVGFHGQTIADGTPGPFQDIVARGFADAQDYWQILFSMDSDFSPHNSFRGALYVETADGTRLWVNASEGGPNFSIDDNLVTNLSNLRSPGFFATSGNSEPKNAIAVASEFPYLNAQGCR